MYTFPVSHFPLIYFQKGKTHFEPLSQLELTARDMAISELSRCVCS